jgi:Asp-tRNA(Asn)/Glu-tRNA(Gln) amidotransferase A subunit family amidase
MKTPTLNRRTFLLATLSAGLPAFRIPDRLESLSDWIRADPQQRESGLQNCLDRIHVMDSSIQAWVQVLPQKPTGAGKLSGIPFAAKDIIETQGLSTEYGSPVYKGRVGTADATIIKDLRSRGAILVGKTHTAAFAYKDPPPTHNPRNLDHTPGGSSSGSAAAVAAGMVPLALGTQTGGSILRPASFCGVTGFKPTYGLISLYGVLQYSRSCDTLGFFTNTPDDMLLLWDALAHPTGGNEEFPLGVPDALPEGVEPAMATAFSAAVASLRKHRVATRAIHIAPMLSELVDAQNVIATYEGARAHQERFNQYGDRLGQVATMVRDGLKIPDTRYDEARRFVSDSRTRLSEIYKGTPVILVPAATGPAPLGLSSTGDSKMNAPWTVLGTPAISIPLPVGSNLPLGLQLTAAMGEDSRVLRTAARLYPLLNAT